MNPKKKTRFYQNVRDVIKRIPQGKVATYGQIASLAGNHRAARQVGWILHSSSNKERLPWHRVINAQGRISLQTQNGYEVQKLLLEDEGVRFDEHGRISLKHYLWNPKRENM